MHRDYPPVYQIINPSDPVAQQKKRWFPGEMVAQQVYQQRALYNHYAALANDYITLKETYDDNVNPKKVHGYNHNKASDWLVKYLTPIVPIWDDIPLRPAKPTYPDAYRGLHLVPSGTTQTALNQVKIDSQFGGWGTLTMGLLKPLAQAEKAFGLIGVDYSQPELGISKAYIAREQGHVINDAEMTDAGAKSKYMIVSVWPNNWQTPPQYDQITQATKPIEIEFGAYAWADLGKQWSIPKRPREATDPLEMNTGARQLVMAFSLSSAALFNVLF